MGLGDTKRGRWQDLITNQWVHKTNLLVYPLMSVDYVFANSLSMYPSVILASLIFVGLRTDATFPVVNMMRTCLSSSNNEHWSIVSGKLCYHRKLWRRKIMSSESVTCNKCDMYLYHWKERR